MAAAAAAARASVSFLAAARTASTVGLASLLTASAPSFASLTFLSDFTSGVAALKVARASVSGFLSVFRPASAFLSAVVAASSSATEASGLLRRAVALAFAWASCWVESAVRPSSLASSAFLMASASSVFLAATACLTAARRFFRSSCLAGSLTALTWLVSAASSLRRLSVSALATAASASRWRVASASFAAVTASRSSRAAFVTASLVGLASPAVVWAAAFLAATAGSFLM